MPRRSGRPDRPDRAPARRQPGRAPVIADAERVARFLDAIRAGVPVGPAAHHAGIAPSAHYRAIEAAEAADAAADAGDTLTDRQRAYREFRDEFERARAAVAVAHVALIGRAARGGQVIRETRRTLPDGTEETETERARPEWKASQWLLSVSFREEFGRDARRVEVTGPDGRPVETSGGPAGDALAAVAERLARVAEEQRQQLAGGWDVPGPAAIESRRLDDEPLDAEVVDDVTGPDA